MVETTSVTITKKALELVAAIDKGDQQAIEEVKKTLDELGNQEVTVQFPWQVGAGGGMVAEY